MGSEHAHSGGACYSGRLSGWLWAVQLTCVFCAFLLFAVLPLSAVYIGVEKALVWGTGVGALLLLLLPSLMTLSYDLFQPLSFVLLTTLVGVTLRSAMLVFSDYAEIQHAAFDRPLEFLLPGGMAILVGLAAFLLGYSVKTPAFFIERLWIISRTRWSTVRMWLLVVLFVATAGISMFLIIKKLGIVFLALSDISGKWNYVGSGAERTYSGLGYLRLGASLAKPAFYILFTWFAASGRRWISVSGLVVILAGIMAVVYPFMSSSRTGVVIILIVAMIIWHYIRRRIRPRILIIALIAALITITIMTAFRRNTNELSTLSAYLTGRQIVDTLILNENFLGIVKTSAIMDALPEKLDYEYGRTFLLWLAAPVPRSLWENKPIISAGEVIGDKVYRSGSGLVGAGVPPGLVAELVWNFGLPGVPVGMFLLGLILKCLHRSFRSYLFKNRNALLVYITLMIPLAFDIPGGNFSGSIVGLMSDAVIISLSLSFIGKRASPGGV